MVLLLCGLGLGMGAGARDEAEEPAVPFKLLDQPPKVIRQNRPTYPWAMRRASLVGEVVVGFIVGKEGTVLAAYPVQSNNPYFERSAVEAVLKWKFEPGRKNGQVVKTAMQVPIIYRFDDASGTELWSIDKGPKHKELPEPFRWDRPPQPVATAFPVYPFEKLLAHEAGTVTANYVVSPEGIVVSVEVKETTAPEFGAAVVAALNQWRFKPPQRAGQPCYAALAMKYEFDPNGRPGEAVPLPEGSRELATAVRRGQLKITPARELDGKLRPISTKPPTYPLAMAEKGLTGQASIEVIIDEDGYVHLPRIATATTLEFGYAAVQAVSGWMFQPPRKDGKSVLTKVLIPVEFNLAATGEKGSRSAAPKAPPAP